ncbi:MAG: hypothetical protein E6I96_16495 [Chloroflexi bacterium]|nr:MAG: hypothetical protein E6I96_16495 [Chloroflexota bacterium]
MTDVLDDQLLGLPVGLRRQHLRELRGRLPPLRAHQSVESAQVHVLARLVLVGERALHRGDRGLAALSIERVERETTVDGILVLHHRALLEDLGVRRHAGALQRFDDPLHGPGIVAPDAVVLDRRAADDVVEHLGLGTAIALDGDGEELRVQALRKAVRRFQIADATPTTGHGASASAADFGRDTEYFLDAERRGCASFPRFMLHEADRGDWADALEQGRIVHFAKCPIPLPAPDDQGFLREGLSPFLRRKNVSYYPGAEKLAGIQAPASVRDRAQRILREHWLQVREFLERAMSGFTGGWTPGTSSFRPLEERGRGLSRHASNELVHVDAGAYGATHGDRILRFFVNLNPSRDRVWISKGTFEELFHRHAEDAGVGRGALQPALPERVLTGLLNVAGKAFPMARVIDSSPYDRRMRRFHNWMKDTPSFQQPPYERFSFAPWSAWMVLTDGVSHACIEGQHALVDTFLIPLRNCRRPAPYQLLAGAA